ncbi:tRNA 2-selenouridine(34) synthase MnmH [Pararhodobacter sp.]|uniref:tRNA 2-selenouridine(34) synthase MnmH n=1 Tax=Pararhodobacter sp. TaxID=2127056 RepID=UPI002AFFB125|nr:tRNA 2-selenouridine(34) synthase MnmH [Pararhodobacter sp.]
MQRITLTSLAALDALPFDEVIDARSPSEYAEDHLPGAINLPVLDDLERAEVGTIYVQESRLRARKLGAARVSRNVAQHLETALADKPADYKPLIYCWRGGQRSGSFAMILGQIGWQVGVLEGGWKTWRKLVQHALYEVPFPNPVLILDGNTGTAKTEILLRVAARGGQVIDLEGLARHRGSLFGLAPGDTQPSQKAFKSALALAVSRLDPTRPVLLEAESNRIGQLRLPPSIWRAMQDAPRIKIDAPIDARATWLTQAYSDIIADPDELRLRIDALAPFHAQATRAEWHQLAEIQDFETLAARLMVEHYDPRYERTALRRELANEVLKTERLDDPALEALAATLAARLG